MEDIEQSKNTNLKEKLPEVTRRGTLAAFGGVAALRYNNLVANGDDDVQNNQTGYRDDSSESSSDSLDDENWYDVINEWAEGYIDERATFEDTPENLPGYPEDVEVESQEEQLYGENDEVDYSFDWNDLEAAIENRFEEEVSEMGVDSDILLENKYGIELLETYKQNIAGEIESSVQDKLGNKSYDVLKFSDEEVDLDAVETELQEDFRDIINGHVVEWIDDNTDEIEDSVDKLEFRPRDSEGDEENPLDYLEMPEDIVSSYENGTVEIRFEDSNYDELLEDDRLTLQELESQVDGFSLDLEKIRNRANEGYEPSIDEFESIKIERREDKDGEIVYVVDPSSLVDLTSAQNNARKKIEEDLDSQIKKEISSELVQSENKESSNSLDLPFEDWFGISENSEVFSHLENLSNRQNAVETVLGDEHEQYDDVLEDIFDDYGEPVILGEGEMTLSQKEVDYINNQYNGEDLAPDNIVSNDWSGDGLRNLDPINLNEEVLGGEHEEAHLSVFGENEFVGDALAGRLQADESGVLFEADGIESERIKDGEKVAGIFNHLIDPLAEGYGRTTEEETEMRKGFRELARFGTGMAHRLDWTQPQHRNQANDLEGGIDIMHDRAFFDEDPVKLFGHIYNGIDSHETSIVETYLDEASNSEGEKRETILEEAVQFPNQMAIKDVEGDVLEDRDINKDNFERVGGPEALLVHLNGINEIVEEETGYNSGYSMVNDAEADEVVKQAVPEEEGDTGGGGSGGDDDDKPPRDGGPIHSVSRELLGWSE